MAGFLTLLPQNKMAAISQTIYLIAFCVNKKFCIFIEISLNVVPKDLNDTNPALF